MQAQLLSALPDRELVALIQRNPENAGAAFEVLYKRWSDKLGSSRYLQGITLDDRQDVLSIFWRKVWRALQYKAPGFRFEGDDRFRGWLSKVLERVCIDHRREQDGLKTWLSSVSLNEETEYSDGSHVELLENIPSEPKHDPVDIEQRRAVIELAGWCLQNKKLNAKQCKLVTLRLLGWPLPSTWTQSWIDTNWHRARKVLIAEWGKGPSNGEGDLQEMGEPRN